MRGSAAHATEQKSGHQDHPARDAGACWPRVSTSPWARTVSRSWGFSGQATSTPFFRASGRMAERNAPTCRWPRLERPGSHHGGQMSMATKRQSRRPSCAVKPHRHPLGTAMVRSSPLDNAAAAGPPLMGVGGGPRNRPSHPTIRPPILPWIGGFFVPNARRCAAIWRPCRARPAARGAAQPAPGADRRNGRPGR